MRAQLDNTCSFITGPGTLMPGVVIFTGMCRYVPEIKEVALTVPLNERLAYVTVDAGIPMGPVATGGPQLWSVDYSKSNVVAIPFDNVPAFAVLFVESVAPYARPIYYRAHVRYRPDLEVLAQEDGGYLLEENSEFILVG